MISGWNRVHGGKIGPEAPSDAEFDAAVAKFGG